VAWRFLTNHGRALLCISHDHEVRIRDLAVMLDVTERSAQKIVGDLVRGGYVTRRRVGRRNVYKVHVERPLPLAHELNLRELLDTFSLDDDEHEVAQVRP
jgi:DNA-binding MarR family transcriptional regulator